MEQSLAFVGDRDRLEYCCTALHSRMAAAPLFLSRSIWPLRSRSRRSRSYRRNGQYAAPTPAYGQQSIGISSQYNPIQRGFLLLVLVQPGYRVLPDDLSGRAGRLRASTGLRPGKYTMQAELEGPGSPLLSNSMEFVLPNEAGMYWNVASNLRPAEAT